MNLRRIIRTLNSEKYFIFLNIVDIILQSLVIYFKWILKVYFVKHRIILRECYKNGTFSNAFIVNCKPIITFFNRENLTTHLYTEYFFLFYKGFLFIHFPYWIK